MYYVQNSSKRQELIIKYEPFASWRVRRAIDCRLVGGSNNSVQGSDYSHIFYIPRQSLANCFWKYYHLENIKR